MLTHQRYHGQGALIHLFFLLPKPRCATTRRALAAIFPLLPSWSTACTIFEPSGMLRIARLSSAACSWFTGHVRIDERGNALFPHWNEEGLCPRLETQNTPKFDAAWGRADHGHH